MRIVEGLDRERLARVLDEMEADDAADLLGEFTESRQAELLGAMDPEEAEPVRRLLIYSPDTAGGLMTPEPVILDGHATVAEALARIRDPDLPVPLAAQVFICHPPLETPTGRFQGVVGIQRLLREAPSKPLSPVPRRRMGADRGRRQRAGGGRTARRLRRRCDSGDGRGQAPGRRGYDRRRARPYAPRGLAHRPGESLMARRDDLGTPRGTPGGPTYDPDTFARLAERMARFLGTGRYLAAQTIFVVVWIILNGIAHHERLGPLSVHPAESRVLDPGGICRAANPAGAEPPGRPGSLRDRARPRGQRSRARRERVPGAGDRRHPARAREKARSRRRGRGDRAADAGDRAHLRRGRRTPAGRPARPRKTKTRPSRRRGGVRRTARAVVRPRGLR